MLVTIFDIILLIWKHNKTVIYSLKYESSSNKYMSSHIPHAFTKCRSAKMTA